MSESQQRSVGLPQDPSLIEGADIIQREGDSRYLAEEENTVTPHASDHNPECINSARHETYIPIVIDSLKPRVGMEFQSVIEVYEFYNLYAKQAGFSVRKGGEKINSKGVIRYKQFLCSKQGQTDNKRSESGEPLKRRYGDTRCKCKASIAFKPTSKLGEKYKVLNFTEEHNHPLTTPRKVHMLRSHRKLSNTRKKLIDTLERSNIRPSQQMTIFEEECGGHVNIGCMRRDIQNYKRDKKEENKWFDAEMLHDYFVEKIEVDPSFVYTIKKDMENRITHVFWCDGVARRNYNKFGTVLCFNTTYKTNRYDMSFAPFIGVNHHGRSILFGCGFLPSEKAENFVWLFKEWKKAMPGEPPACIVTDQDLGMTKAIAEVFPNATHRYCIWHIMDKAPKYLGTLAFDEKFKYDFNKVVYKPETPTEFETAWVDFIERFELSQKAWLNDLYEMRGKWVPAYLRGRFFAAMQSTQRSKTINKMLKEHVEKSNSFCESMLKYERFIRRHRHLELQDDHETLNSKPRLKTSSDFEQQLADLYTKRIFFQFQDELFDIMACRVTKITEDDNVSSFSVTPPTKESELHSDKPRRIYDRPRIVVLQKSNNYASCSCRMFEFEGIPCRHLLTVIVKIVDIVMLPKEYILERWTRDAKKRGCHTQ